MDVAIFSLAAESTSTLVDPFVEASARKVSRRRPCAIVHSTLYGTPLESTPLRHCTQQGRINEFPAFVLVVPLWFSRP